MRPDPSDRHRLNDNCFFTIHNWSLAQFWLLFCFSIAQVITDATTARSKGYGFVRFASEVERDRALNEMNGHFLSNRPIRVSLATARKNAVSAGAVIPHIPHPSDFDPTNTTLFIGGLSSQVSEDQLRAVFSRFGDIIYVKIPQGKGCGFVQFVLRTSAERAMVGMNGQVLGNSAIRISWGRSSSRAANQLSSQMTGLASGFPSGNFPGGPFAGMPPDPMLFAAVAAGGYGNVPSSAAQFVPQSGGVSANINNDFANINLNAMNTASNGIALPAPGMEALVADHHYGMPAYTPSPAHSLTGNSPPPPPHPHPPPSTGLLNGKGVAGDSLPSGVGLNGISLPVMIPQSSGAPSQVVPPSVVNVNSAPPNARNHHGSVGEGSNAISAGASPAKDGVPSLVKEYEMGGNAGNAIASANANLKTNSDSDSNTGSGKSSSAISEHAGKAAGQYNSAGKSTSSSGAMPGAQLLASLLV